MNELIKSVEIEFLRGVPVKEINFKVSKHPRNLRLLKVSTDSTLKSSMFTFHF